MPAREASQPGEDGRGGDDDGDDGGGEGDASFEAEGEVSPLVAGTERAAEEHSMGFCQDGAGTCDSCEFKLECTEVEGSTTVLCIPRPLRDDEECTAIDGLPSCSVSPDDPWGSVCLRLLNPPPPPPPLGGGGSDDGTPWYVWVLVIVIPVLFFAAGAGVYHHWRRRRGPRGGERAAAGAASVVSPATSAATSDGADSFDLEGGGVGKEAELVIIPAKIKGGKLSAQSSAGSAAGGSDGDGDDPLASLEIPYADLEFVSRVGVGATGEVMLAKWRGTDVAVKRLFHLLPVDGGWDDGDDHPPAEAAGQAQQGQGGGAAAVTGTTEAQRASASALAKFRQEAATLCRLRHPHVVQLMGVSLPGGGQPACVVMEFCRRGSLDRLLHDTEAPFDARMRWRVAKQVAQGVHFLHTSEPRVIHRDLKPANVLLTGGWDAKICDFGLSRESYATCYSMGSQTAAGVGTPAYMAPEVWRAEPVSDKVDVYGYGVILWQMLCRERPYADCSSPLQVMAAVAYRGQGLPDREEELRPSQGPSDAVLWGLWRRCTQPDPADRPAFGEICEELRVAPPAAPAAGLASPQTSLPAPEPPATATAAASSARPPRPGGDHSA